MENIDLLDNYLNNHYQYTLTIDKGDTYEIYVNISKNRRVFSSTYDITCRMSSHGYLNCSDGFFKKTFNKLSDLVVYVNDLKNKGDKTTELQSLIKLEMKNHFEFIEKEGIRKEEEKKILENIKKIFN
jgi:hypothetical protein